MILDSILKCLGNLTPSQRKVLAKEIIGTDFFLALLISRFISNEKPRLKTFIGFDTNVYEELMLLIASHPKMEKASKKTLQTIENCIYNWLTNDESLDHYQVYDAFGF